MAPKLINVRLKLTSGRMVCFPVAPGTTTHQLCQKVAEEERVDGGPALGEAPFVCIRFEDKILKRTKTIADYGITEEMVLRVMVMIKSAIFVYLVLSDPEEELSCGLYNISVLSDIKLKLLEARPGLASNKITFHIGDMQLNLKSCAYEACLEDGEKITVRVTEVRVRELGDDEMPPQEDMEELIEQAECAYPFGSGLTSMKKMDVVISLSIVRIEEDVLSLIQKELEGAITRLQCDIPDIRIGFMVHASDYTLMVHDLSSELTKMAEFVTTLAPVETRFTWYEWMLRNACGLSWRVDAKKILIIVGHTQLYPPIYPITRSRVKMDWRVEIERLRDKGVRVHSMQGRPYYHHIAQFTLISRLTGGMQFLFFDSFFSVIDLILGVCYGECGADLLQAFIFEVRDERRLPNDSTVNELHKLMRWAMKDQPEESRVPADADTSALWQRHPAGFNIAQGWSDASLFPRDLPPLRLPWYKRCRRSNCTIM